MTPAETSDLLAHLGLQPRQRPSDGVTVAACPKCEAVDGLQVRRAPGDVASLHCSSGCLGEGYLLGSASDGDISHRGFVDNHPRP